MRVNARRRLTVALCLLSTTAATHARPPPAPAVDDAGLARALALALHRLDRHAPPPAVDMPRLRYHVRLLPLADGYRIEPARYNLGAAVHHEAIAGYGHAQVATPAIVVAGEREPPAQVALALLAVMDARPPGSTRPGPRELVIDVNLGNDTGSDALLFSNGCLLWRHAAGTDVRADYRVADAGCAAPAPAEPRIPK